MRYIIALFLAFTMVVPSAVFAHSQPPVQETVELTEEEASIWDKVFSYEVGNGAFWTGFLGGLGLMFIGLVWEAVDRSTRGARVGNRIVNMGFASMAGGFVVCGIIFAVHDYRNIYSREKVSLLDLNEQFSVLKVEEAYLNEAHDNPFLASNYWVSQKVYLESTIDYMNLVDHPQKQSILAQLGQQLAQVDDELSGIGESIALLSEEQFVAYANQESDVYGTVDADQVRHDVELAIQILEHRITGSPPSRG